MGSTGRNISTVRTISEETRSATTASIASLNSSKRYQEFTATNTYDGHKVSVSVEKVTTRDYWGKSTGRQTYTLYVWDEDSRNEYGNRERLYYNYGIEGIKRVKDDLRRILGAGTR